MNTYPKKNGLFVVTLSALGVVYGDIGTSPLYALRECFHGPHALPLTDANVFGVLSLIIWALIMVISVKYILYVLRADNRGEGGVLALTSLVHPRNTSNRKDRLRIFLFLGLFGAALLYGDGAITPAISVLSAMEGLEVATPLMQPYVVPATVAILFLVFFIQSRGTGRIGIIFGPVITLWFLLLALLGIRGILLRPEVLGAFSPLPGFHFFVENGRMGFLALGAIFLVVTGGEALYADMGHFGKTPIKVGWFLVVLPALLLNYLGQGALLLSDKSLIVNPFYSLVPQWALYPMVVLATSAAVIASQALISGTYSLTRQAIQLGYLPRMEIIHTSAEEKGQIYLPLINWILCLATIALVVFFKTSSQLAAAYGMAVTATMLITTILTYYVARYRWKWNRVVVIGITLYFLTLDLGFLCANIMKFVEGGWIPLAIGVGILTLMTTWQNGRALLVDRLRSRSVPLDQFLKTLESEGVTRVDGTAVFMTGTLEGTPPALIHNVKHNRVLHRNVIIIKVRTLDIPRVAANDRANLEVIAEGIFKVTLNYGFMDSPDIPTALVRCHIPNVRMELKEITYFLGRETLLATNRPGMAIWREKLFVFMSRNAQRAMSFFRLPTAQVVEIGIQIEL